MQTPRWAEDLAINACIYLGIDNVPRVICRRSKAEQSSGHAYYWGKDKHIDINMGTSRMDAKLVILHEIAHIAKPPKETKVPYKEWYDKRRLECRKNHTVIAPFDPSLQHRMITTKSIHHSAEFWDTAWALYRWAKLPIWYCKEREYEYRQGAVTAYLRSKRSTVR